MQGMQHSVQPKLKYTRHYINLFFLFCWLLWILRDKTLHVLTNKLTLTVSEPPTPLVQNWMTEIAWSDLRTRHTYFVRNYRSWEVKKETVVISLPYVTGDVRLLFNDLTQDVTVEDVSFASECREQSSHVAWETSHGNKSTNLFYEPLANKCLLYTAYSNALTQNFWLFSPLGASSGPTCRVVHSIVGYQYSYSDIFYLTSFNFLFQQMAASQDVGTTAHPLPFYVISIFLIKIVYL